jgi:hypothetical protein
MLPVETMFDTVTGLELGNGPICIVLHSCCEDYYLKMLRHFFQKVVSIGPYEQLPLHIVLPIVNQSLIQVEYQCIGFLIEGLRPKIWRGYQREAFISLDPQLVRGRLILLQSLAEILFEARSHQHFGITKRNLIYLLN